MHPRPRGSGGLPSLLGGAGWAVAVLVPLGFIALFFLWPVLTLIATGFVDDGRLDLSGIAEVFGANRTWQVIGQTLLQATLATVLSVLL